MANYTFKKRIHNLTGISENDVSSDWLTDAAREIISILPEDRASAAAEEIILPFYTQELFKAEVGVVNIIKFTSLPGSPYNTLDKIFKEVQGKVIFINHQTPLGETIAYATWNGDSWIGSLAILEVGIGYNVTCNQDVTFFSPQTSVVIENGILQAIFPIDKSRILNIVRYDGTHWLPCRQIDSIMKGKAEVDSGYMEEATSTDPVYYYENNRVVVLPTPSDTGLKISKIRYPSIGRDEFNLPRFPDEFEHIVTLGACLKAKQYLIARAHEEEDIELATSHSNHLNLLRQDYQTALQIVTAGLTQSQGEKAREEA